MVAKVKPARRSNTAKALRSHGDDIAGTPLRHELREALGAIVAIAEEDLLAGNGDVLDDPLVAVVGEGGRVDLRRAIAVVESGGLLGLVPHPADPAADEHQVALFWREARTVPIDDVQTAVGADEDISGVEVGMAEGEIAVLVAHSIGEPGGAPHDDRDVIALGGEQGGKFGGDTIAADVRHFTHEAGDAVAPSRSEPLSVEAIGEAGGQPRLVDPPYRRAKRRPALRRQRDVEPVPPLDIGIEDEGCPARRDR